MIYLYRDKGRKILMWRASFCNQNNTTKWLTEENLFK